MPADFKCRERAYASPSPRIASPGISGPRGYYIESDNYSEEARELLYRVAEALKAVWESPESSRYVG